MRAIKFRAWDKKKKKMWRPYENTTMTHGECIDDFDDDVLMQYTGLKDKNGKEIYEGDIVRISETRWKDDNGKDAYETNTRNREVRWDSGMFILYQEALPVSQYELQDIEIIGNIYENGNLLK